MLPPNQVIKKYCLTEKTGMLSSNLNQYVFEVFPNVTRSDVAAAVAKLFSVKVARVNIVCRKGKIKRSRTERGKYVRMSEVKRAVISLEKGQKIEVV